MLVSQFIQILAIDIVKTNVYVTITLGRVFIRRQNAYRTTTVFPDDIRDFSYGPGTILSAKGKLHPLGADTSEGDQDPEQI